MAKYLVAIWVIVVLLMLFLFAGMYPEFVNSAPEGQEFTMGILLLIILAVAVVSAYGYTSGNEKVG